MSVRIRLRRVGRKKQPYYRVVVTDKAAPRDGAYIDNVGFYNPRRQPAELQLDLERVDAWIARGAQLSESAAVLVRKARRGGDSKVKLIVPGREPEPKPAGKPAAAKPAPAAPKSEPVEAEAAVAAAPEAAAPAEAPEAAAPEAVEAAGSAEPGASAEAEPTEGADATGGAQSEESK